jgi:S-adenosylmethionine decarboxylase
MKTRWAAKERFVFGPHLLIDGTHCDTRKLADRILVERILSDYPAAIGMTKIGGPYMFEYQAPDPAYSGVSGLVVIAESHIAIHTFPELDYFTMDIFSCKNFDHEKAITYIKEAFDVQEMDRMLVQRGLSFKGPHHGPNGATDELIAAAEARLAAGIVSKETALTEPTLASAREVAQSRAQGEGLMIWPTYGVTPDYGTYGASARAGATVAALGHEDEALTLPNGRTLTASEPPLVNPTASISGLLDKLSAGAGLGRAMGKALATWENLLRAEDTTIALTLDQPIIAAGARETLIYAVERRYVDVVIASADDLFSDLYESLGCAHYVDDTGVVAREGCRAETLTYLRDFLSQYPAQRDQPTTTAALWRALGEALAGHAPRKGLLESAAQFGVALFTPDLAIGGLGAAPVALDAGADLLALARTLAAHANLGLLHVGTGPADALVAQAREAATALGAAAALATDAMLPTDASLALPLFVTALAQRFPGVRYVAEPAPAREMAEVGA